MKTSLFAVALVSGVALAGSVSAQGIVNGVAGSDQHQMAPVGTKAPNSGDTSASSMPSDTMPSNTMSSSTAMNDGSTRTYSSDATSAPTNAPNQLVNGVAGTDQPGVAPVGTKAPNSGANSTGEAPAQ